MDKKKSSTGNPNTGDYLTYGIYRITETILRLLPMGAVCIIGSCLGQLAYHLMPRRRAIVMRNLRIVYGDHLDLPKIRALARKTFRHSGLNLIASIPASTMSNDELVERVEIEGLEHYLNAQNQGKGCILLLAHMGNWEILTQLTVLVPEIKALGSLYRPLNNPILDKLVKRRRQSKGAKLYSREDGFTKPITHLKQGGTLGCIADQSAGKHGMMVPFFGKQSSMTNLPALLHRKTQAPIIPLSMCTVAPGKWKVIVQPAIEVPDAIKKDTYQTTIQCARAYEKLMTQSPADVLWMHNYWRGGKRTALKARGQIPRNINATAHNYPKPFRILIHTGNTITAKQLTEVLSYLRTCRKDLHITLAGRHTDFPEADICLEINPSEPPHLGTNALKRLEESMPTPFDCALDLSIINSGIRLFKQTGISPYFALTSPPKPTGNTPMPVNSNSPYEARLEYFITRISPTP